MRLRTVSVCVRPRSTPLKVNNNLLASQVSAWELQVWSTPDGMLAEEVGQGPAFKAEIVADKNVRKVPTLHSRLLLARRTASMDGRLTCCSTRSNAGTRSVEERLLQR